MKKKPYSCIINKFCCKKQRLARPKFNKRLLYVKCFLARSSLWNSRFFNRLALSADHYHSSWNLFSAICIFMIISLKTWFILNINSSFFSLCKIKKYIYIYLNIATLITCKVCSRHQQVLHTIEYLSHTLLYFPEDGNYFSAFIVLFSVTMFQFSLNDPVDLFSF